MISFPFKIKVPVSHTFNQSEPFSNVLSTLHLGFLAAAMPPSGGAEQNYTHSAAVPLGLFPRCKTIKTGLKG